MLPCCSGKLLERMRIEFGTKGNHRQGLNSFSAACWFSSKLGGAITTPSAHMAAWDTGRRPRKRSLRQAGRPAPLRSAGHPAWPRNRQCTNIPTGPVAGGRSPVHSHSLAGVVPGGTSPQASASENIFDRTRDDLVGLVRRVTESVVQGRHLRAVHRAERKHAQLGHDVGVDCVPVVLHCGWGRSSPPRARSRSARPDRRS